MLLHVASTCPKREGGGRVLVTIDPARHRQRDVLWLLGRRDPARHRPVYRGESEARRMICEQEREGLHAGRGRLGHQLHCGIKPSVSVRIASAAGRFVFIRIIAGAGHFNG